MSTPEEDREGPRQDDRSPANTGIRRRHVLALSAATVTGGFAGCGGGDGDGTTPTNTETPTSTSAATPTPTSTDAPTSTAPTSTEPTTTSTTTAEPSIGAVTDILTAPSSDIKPTDGFADPQWLLEDDPEIIKVTSLDAEGPGTLRDAILTKTPRIVVFEVGGVIDLGNRDLTIPDEEGYDRIFIAGQTAPPPGITAIRGEISPYAKDCILQHLRVRVGDDVGDAYDSISIGTLAGNTVVDHCSTSWSVDENLSSDGGQDVRGKTISNNLIAEGLHDSIHSKGPHSMGTLIEENAPEIAIIGNVYSSNNQRHPRLKGGVTAVVVNNFAFNFGIAVGLGGEGDIPTTMTFIGNHYRSGRNTDTSQSILFKEFGKTPEVYEKDTLIERDSIPLDNGTVEYLDSEPLWPETGLEPMPASEVYDHNLATAGARPAERTHHDERIFNRIRDKTAKIIDSQSEVGGYPTLDSTQRSLDVPEYGPEFAQWLAQHTRAVELGEAPP